MFLPGMWGGPWIFDRWLKLAAAHEISAIGIDYGAAPNIGSISLEDYVTSVRRIVTKLDRPVVLVGHSMSGLIVQRIAELGLPQLRGVVLLSSLPPRGIFFGWPLVRLMLRRLRYAKAIASCGPLVIDYDDIADSALNHVEDPPDVYKRLLPGSGTAAKEIARGIAVDHTKVVCPMLVIGTKDDRLVPSSVQRRTAERYGAPYIEFEGGHLLPLERNATKAFEAILDFCGQL